MKNRFFQRFGENPNNRRVAATRTRAPSLKKKMADISSKSGSKDELIREGSFESLMHILD